MSTPTPQAVFSRYELASGAGGRWAGEAPDEVRGGCTDTRQLSPGCLFVALEGERFDGHAFVEEALARGAAAAMVSERWYRAAPLLPAAPSPPGRGSSPAAMGSAALGRGGLLVVKDTLASLGALARLHRRRFDLPVVGVTGSNGKTTTREMLGCIVRTRGPALVTEGNLNNEIGVPLTLLGLDAAHQHAVVELGMSHAGEIARLTALAEPRVGVVTLAGPAHLEALGSLEGVADAKAELWFGLPRDGVCVANAGDARMLERARACERPVITFAGLGGCGDVVALSLLDHGPHGMHFTLGLGQREVEVRLPLVGLHNAANAAAAAAAAMALGFGDREIALGLGQVKAVGRRLRIEELASGVLLLDDCYNANPASMAAALSTLRELAGNRRALAVLGDMLELGEEEEEAHRALGAKAAASGLSALFCFGPRTRHAAEAAREAGLAEVTHTTDVAELARAVAEALTRGDVLLVKGSRGNRLERLVEALGAPSDPLPTGSVRAVPAP